MNLHVGKFWLSSTPRAWELQIGRWMLFVGKVLWSCDRPGGPRLHRFSYRRLYVRLWRDNTN